MTSGRPEKAVVVTGARWRVVGGFLVFGLICLALLAGLSSAVAGDAVQRQIDDRVTAVGAHSATYIDQIFASQVAALRTYATNPEILASAYGGDPARATATLVQLAAFNHNVTRAILVHPDGRVTAASDRQVSAPDAAGSDVSAASWWAGARNGGTAVSGTSGQGSDATVWVSIGAPRPGASPGESVAVIAIEYNLNALATSLRDFSKAQGISLLVSDRAHDNLVSYGDGAGVWLTAAGSQPLTLALAGQEGVLRTTVNGREHLVAYTSARGPAWVVVASIPTLAAFAPVRQLQFWLFIITAALALIFIVGVRHLDSALRGQQTAEIGLRRAAIELEHQASHDSLTGLGNRALYTDRLAQALREAQRRHESVTVLFLDLNHFKPVNDTLGHHTGDLLLREVGTRMVATLRESDTSARFGGDEFAVVLPNTDGPGGRVVLEKLGAALEAPYEVGGHTVISGASIGLAVFPTDGATVEKLMSHADTEMYSIKRKRQRTTR